MLLVCLVCCCRFFINCFVRKLYGGCFDLVLCVRISLSGGRLGSLCEWLSIDSCVGIV